MELPDLVAMASRRFASEVLVIMAKEPVRGTVKTRLAKHMGAAWACDLYGAFLRDLQKRFRDCGAQLVWAVHPPGANLGGLVGGDDFAIDQRGDDLGERMRNCFEDLLSSGAERVAMIGADAPHLGDEMIAEAFAFLCGCDVVLAPTRDGGYCLVAMGSPHDIFSGVAMSTPRVYAETRRRIEFLGLRLVALPETFDVDEPEDVSRLEALLASGRVKLPHTAAVLAARR